MKEKIAAKREQNNEKKNNRVFTHIVLKVLDKGLNGKHDTVEWII